MRYAPDLTRASKCQFTTNHSAAVSVDVKASKKKDSVKVKVDGGFSLTHIANTAARVQYP